MLGYVNSLMKAVGSAHEGIESQKGGPQKGTRECPPHCHSVAVISTPHHLTGRRGAMKAKNNPLITGRLRLWKKFNAKQFPFTSAFRIEDLAPAITLVPQHRGVALKGWFQGGEDVTALYARGSARVLLERISSESGPDRCFVCVGACTWEEVAELSALVVQAVEGPVVVSTGEVGTANE